MKVVIVNYGLGNIKSIESAFRAVGTNPWLSNCQSEILDADAMILPGVGAFEEGMKGLLKSKLENCVLDFCASGKPVLGICLGMQMLFEESFEFGRHQGLGVIKGAVRRIAVSDTFRLKLPHIGWGTLSEAGEGWHENMFSTVKSDDYFYFVHSYAGESDSDYCIATTRYGDHDVCAAVRRENIYGCQFHPEKSGDSGLNLLRNFVNISDKKVLA